MGTLQLPTDNSSPSPAKSEPLGSTEASPPKAESTSYSGSAKSSAAKSSLPAGDINFRSDLSAESDKRTFPTGHKRVYPLYPSVIQLLHQNGLDAKTAGKIPATGPGGRLLKGDVLAYLGAIESTYPREQSDRLAKLSHLNLTNINRTTARQPSPSIPSEKETPLKQIETRTEITIPISFAAVKKVQQRVHDALGIDVSLATFIARAAEISNTDLPRPNTPPTADELFDQVLGLSKVGAKHSHGSFNPQVIALPTFSGPAKPSHKECLNIIDVLTGTRAKSQILPSPRPRVPSEAVPLSSFSLVVSQTDKIRGRVFLERMKTILQVDPGKLVL